MAAGLAVLEGMAGLNVKTLTIPGDTSVSDRKIEEIKDRVQGSGLIIAVGAGTINDFGKYVSMLTGIPYWAVPTAPSMNGYTSSIAAVKVKGVKRTLPAPPPPRIYVNPAVIKNSPPVLRQAGFCDILAKSVSDFDWQTESLLFNGSYCHLPAAIVAEQEHRYLEHPKNIARGEENAVMGLFEGLLLSGAAMTLAGSSAPASGGEHLISHFLDMREVITGRKPALHGLQVGAGVILSSVCYRMLAELDEKDLPGKAGENIEKDAQGIKPTWGRLASEVEHQFRKKQERLLAFDDLLPQNWPQLKQIFHKVGKPEYFLELIRKTGFEMNLPALDLTRDEFVLAALSGRTIRDRITVLDLAAQTGVLSEAVNFTLEMF